MTTKKVLSVAVTAAFIIAGLYACNEKIIEKKDTPATADVPQNYPYKVDHPDNWEIGSNTNTLTALNSLKAWEEGKMEDAMKYFADTIWVQFDALDKKMPNDSLKAMFTGGWHNYKTVKIRMDDFESVISKNKSEEWVTLWYTQSWETREGVKDSSAVINDLQLKGGKIIRLDEYNRKLH